MSTIASYKQQCESDCWRQQHPQQPRKSMWLWRSDYETWEMFSQEEMAKIQTAHDSYSDGLVLERGDAIYYIDLSKNTQTNTTTGRMRLLRHIPMDSKLVYQTRPSSPTLPEAGTESQNSSSNRTGSWTAFSQQETAKLEEALFARNEGVVLERGADTFYVDFQRWIMTDLKRNTAHSIQLANSIINPPVDSDLNSTSRSTLTAAVDRPKKEMESRVLLGSSSATRPPPLTTYVFRPPPSSPWQEILGKNYSAPSSWMLASASSEGTGSTVSTRDSQSSILYEASAEDLAAPFMNKRNSNNGSGRRNSNSDALWLWRNNEGRWSTFDDRDALTIEKAFVKGETGVVLQRVRSLSSSNQSDNDGNRTTYFLDLVDMTQTNLQTNYVRKIERREDW